MQGRKEDSSASLPALPSLYFFLTLGRTKQGANIALCSEVGLGLYPFQGSHLAQPLPVTPDADLALPSPPSVSASPSPRDARSMRGTEHSSFRPLSLLAYMTRSKKWTLPLPQLSIQELGTIAVPASEGGCAKETS